MAASLHQQESSEPDSSAPVADNNVHSAELPSDGLQTSEIDESEASLLASELADSSDLSDENYLSNPTLLMAGEGVPSSPSNTRKEIPSLIETTQATQAAAPAAPSNNLIIVTSFVERIANSGAVWALRTDKKKDPTLLISDLHQPVGLCYDELRHFLYVCDLLDEKTGAVYQFYLETNGDYSEQTREDGRVVYKGTATDCVVDSQGSLILTDYATSQIVKVALVWQQDIKLVGVSLAKNTITNKVLYQPIAIDFTQDGNILVTNHGGSFETGLMTFASLQDSTVQPTTYLKYPIPGRGLAVCGNNAYYISGRTINSLDLTTGDVYVMVKFEKYYYIKDVECDDTHLYASDANFGRIYVLPLDGSIRMLTVGKVPYARAMLLTTDSAAERLLLSLFFILVLQ